MKWDDETQRGKLRVLLLKHSGALWILVSRRCPWSSCITVLSSMSERMRPLVWSSRFLVVILIMTSLNTELLMANLFPPPWVNSPRGAWASSLSRLRDHSDTSHSIGLLWMSDRPDTENPTWQLTTLNKRQVSHARGRIRTHNASKREAAKSRLRPCGHRDRQWLTYWMILHKW